MVFKCISYQPSPGIVSTRYSSDESLTA